jgi:nicotinate-nucleotide adenylyltransferase
MKWGLFGGTFDPVHVGHLRCAEEVLELFALDKVFFIPAHRQPLKTDREILSFHHRERMISLAVAGNPSFAVSDMEEKRGGRSYSVATVRSFLKTAPAGTELYFILGQDAFSEIPRWKEWDELLRLCNFIVMTRPGHPRKTPRDIFPSPVASQFSYDDDADGFMGPAGRFIFFRTLTLLDISSTDIRNRVEGHQSIRYLVPEPVREYILGHSEKGYFS